MSQTHAMASAAAKAMDADLKPLLETLAASLEAAPAIESPYRHWLPQNLLPEAMACVCDIQRAPQDASAPAVDACRSMGLKSGP